jgi:deoxycytidine triphosphate deaminase
LRRVHVTAPHAHAGWYGRLTLEIFNYGPFNIELKPRVPIGQLYFWRVEDPIVASEVKVQQFTGQARATGE